MADETDKLAEALEHILTKYEGAEDDPVWQQAKQTLEGMKPKPVFLFCPKCKFLHVDEGEWATKPHKTHLCTECGHKWRPHAYPTVGIAFPEMDARETMGFLRFFEAWQRRFKQDNPAASDAQVRYLQKILGDGWTASRDFWLAQAPQQRQPAKAKSNGRAAPDDDPEIQFDDPGDPNDIPPEGEADPQIAKYVQEGKLDWEDIEGMGFDPRVYVPYGLKSPSQTVAETNAASGDIASELGIEFDGDSGLEGDYDPDTGISF